MKLLPILAAAVFAATLPTLARAKDPAPDPVAVGAGFDAAQQADKLLKIAEAQAFKGVTRVAVPLFTVEFVTADSVSAQTSGFAAAGRSNVSVHYALKGVAEPELQALTDQLYADFLRDLKAAGIDVLPQSQLQASSIYRKLAAGGSPAPIKSDSAMTLAPPGMAIYGFSKSSAGTGGGSSLFGALSAMASGFSAVGAVLETVELQKELAAAIVEVQMRVHFVQLTNNNKGFLGRMATSASVDAQVLPTITSASMSVQSSTRGSLTLSNPLALDATAFAEVRSAPTTAGDVAGAVLVGLIRLASRSGDSSSSNSMEAVADPARYRAVVGAGLGTVSQMFVHRLRSGL